MEKHWYWPRVNHWVSKGSSRIVIIFTRAYTEYAGGSSKWPPYALKNVDFGALHFHTGVVKNQHFQSTVLGRRQGGHKKEYYVNGILANLQQPTPVRYLAKIHKKP